MSNLYPEVRDTSNLTGVLFLDQFLAVGIEGQKDAGGTAAVGIPQLITDPVAADTLFGPASNLAALVKFVLAQGINYVWAVASASGSVPLLAARQTAWQTLEENPDVRIRLTDSETQADLIALGTSCTQAEAIQNKQFAFGGLASPTTLATLTAAAIAINSQRMVLVGPGYYDSNGVLRGGRYAAARVACEVARNADITDDLDLVNLAATTGLEKEIATGMPLLRNRAGATPTNNFATALTAGVSPLGQNPATGQAQIIHLRMTYTGPGQTDSTYDALQTRLIKDELFIRIRNMLLGEKFLRRGNTPSNRGLAAKRVDDFLIAHSDWAQPIVLPNGAIGYGVTVTPSGDKKKMIVSYQGEIVRNTQVIEVGGNLTIPA
jgi:hypothetical protein